MNSQQILSKAAHVITIFLLAFIIYTKSPVAVSTDSIWSLFVARSLIHDGDIYLDEYKHVVKARDNYGIRKRHGHIINYFPLGASLYALPFVYICELSDKVCSRIFPNYIKTRSEYFTFKRAEFEKGIASLLLAATASILLAILWRLGISSAIAFLTVFTVVFGTSFWSVASRGLWPHAPVIFSLTCGLYFILRSSGCKTTWNLLIAGFFFAFAYICRPTASIIAALFFFYACATFRWRSVWFVLGVATVLIPFFASNLTLYDSFLPKYYQPKRVSWHGDFIEAFFANLFSPNRGLFVFSPVLLFIAFAWDVRRNYLIAVLWLSILMHIIITSLFPNWWGGHTYGPRYMSDMLPFFAILLAFGLTRVWHLWFAKLSFFGCLALSIVIHMQGAIYQSTMEWNVANRRNIDNHTERVWDWQDLQILSGGMQGAQNIRQEGIEPPTR